MNNKRSTIHTLFKITDLLVIVSVFLCSIALVLSQHTTTSWSTILELRITIGNALFVAAYLAAWHLVLAGWGLYRSYRLAPARRELRHLASAVTVAVLPLWPAGQLFDFEYVSPAFLISFACLVFVALTIERQILRLVARALRRRGMNLRSAVIIGDTTAVREMADNLLQRGDLGYSLIESITLAPERYANKPDIEAQAIKARLEELTATKGLDEVFLVLPIGGSDGIASALIAHCEEQGIMVRVITRIADLTWARVIVDEVAGQPVLSIFSGPPHDAHLAAKRVIDIIGAAIGLLVSLPLMVAAAIAIKLDSGGPVFFRQERIGINRRRFTTYKFRTMVADADGTQADLEALNEADGPVFKIKNDPRITRVGEFLRRSSIDELPQLFNVIKNDMSLVGPRPLPVRDVEKMDVRWHRRRFAVKPGITCIWQAKSREPKFDDWIKSDMEYIDSWSLALDMRILLKTIPAVIMRQGAH